MKGLKGFRFGTYGVQGLGCGAFPTHPSIHPFNYVCMICIICKMYVFAYVCMIFCMCVGK